MSREIYISDLIILVVILIVVMLILVAGIFHLEMRNNKLNEMLSEIKRSHRVEFREVDPSKIESGMNLYIYDAKFYKIEK